MKVSVIVEDKTVVVDGEGIEIPADRWPSTPSDVWAYQWDGSVGTTESNVKGTSHVEFTDIATVQPYIDIRTTIINEIKAAKAAIESEPYDSSAE